MSISSCLSHRTTPLLLLTFRLPHHRRLVMAAGLEMVVQAPQLQSFNHPTQVVIIPPKVSKVPGSLALIPQAVLLSVNRFGCGGNKSSLTGAFFIPPQSELPPSAILSLTFSFHHITAYLSPIYCIALSTFLALSLAEIPSPSPKALYPRAMTPAPALTGLLISRAEPICLLSLVMIAESVPAEAPHSRLLTHQTVPV